MLATIRTCLGFLPATARWRWLALVPLAVMAAAAEAIGAAGLFGLVRIVADPTVAARMPVAATFYALLPWHDARHVVLAFTAALAVFFALKNALQAVQAYLGNEAAAAGIAGLSERLFGAYLRSPYAVTLVRDPAEAIRDVTSTVDTVFRMVMAPAVALASEVCVVVALVGLLFAVAPGVTLVVATSVAGAAAVLVAVTGRVFERWGARLLDFEHAILKLLQQTLGALKEVKLLGRERFFHEAFTARQAAAMRVRHLHATLSTVPRLIVEVVFVSGACLLIALVVLLDRPPADVVPLLGLYAYAGFRAVPSANRITFYLGQIRAGTAAVERLRTTLAALAPYADDATEAAGADGRLPFADRLVLEHVSYAYDGATRPALADVCLTIRRGETVGIVGATGAGKSTLLDVFTGLLAPTAGRVRVDGRDVAESVRAWQRTIGYVPQTVVLIDDTIRRNVALGVADDRIDEARVRDAVRMAQLEASLTALPRGLDTVVGERGVRLSGGERQRIGIARALYHGPDLVVLDEATSALDNRTEADLLHAVAGLPGGPTIVVVAHRASTLRACERLIVLAEGRVAASGSYEELLRDSPAFRRMAIAEPGGERRQS